MKMRKVVWLAGALVAVGLFLSGQVRQGKSAPQGTQGQGAMQMGPERMQQMMKGMSENPTMRQCQIMMRARIQPESPATVLALKHQLSLSEEQVKKLSEIQETANREARSVLGESQSKKLEALTRGWNPQSMMHGMEAMMSEMHKMTGDPMPQCPMMQMMAGKK